MIIRNYINAWKKIAPWREPRQVEQDLVITRAIISLYSNSVVQKSLAFCGGTALNKFYFNPATRYSEDIDLVKIDSQPLDYTLNIMRETLDCWLGIPKLLFSDEFVTLTYAFTSEEGFPLAVLIEINTTEQFSILGFEQQHFTSNSEWCPGSSIVLTYKIEELLGTKMRALYQRTKGRDLFDLYTALTVYPELKTDDIIKCFKEYIQFTGNTISKNEFLENVTIKLSNQAFREDVLPLLPPDKMFDVDMAYNVVKEKLIDNIL